MRQRQTVHDARLLSSLAREVGLTGAEIAEAMRKSRAHVYRTLQGTGGSTKMVRDIVQEINAVRRKRGQEEIDWRNILVG